MSLVKMKLRRRPFEQIAVLRQKTIELRLFDEKRQSLRVGDIIEFSCMDAPLPPFTARITALHRFNSFAELYASLPLLKCGYTEETVKTASPEDMDIYYPPEEQIKYGVVGIELQLLSEQ